MQNQAFLLFSIDAYMSAKRFESKNICQHLSAIYKPSPKGLLLCIIHSMNVLLGKTAPDMYSEYTILLYLPNKKISRRIFLRIRERV